MKVSEYVKEVIENYNNEEQRGLLRPYELNIISKVESLAKEKDKYLKELTELTEQVKDIRNKISEKQGKIFELEVAENSFIEALEIVKSSIGD